MKANFVCLECQANPAFFRSARLLASPLTLLMLGGLLVNDHLLRRFWPSWWTGKIGDFAWLFVAPVAICILLSWVVPARWKRQEKLVGLLAYGLTAVAFILLKIVPVFRDFVLRLWENSLGFPAVVVIDPSDLLALSALALSALLWWHQSPTPFSVPLRAWLVLPLFALFTLADANYPDPGIHCLSLKNGQVFASAPGISLVSSDGGLSWTKLEAYCRECCSPRDKLFPLIIDLPDATLRSTAGERVDISRDGGQTWHLEYTLKGGSEARDAYYMKRYVGGVPIIQPVPLDALYDPISGNVIFAMGHQGVLVRSPDAVYTWVSAGDYGSVYRQLDLNSPAAFSTVLKNEIVLAGNLVLLLLVTRIRAVWEFHGKPRSFPTFPWVMWGTAALYFLLIQPGPDSYPTMVLSPFFLLLPAVSVSIYSIFIYYRQTEPRAILTAGVIGLAIILMIALLMASSSTDFSDMGRIGVALLITFIFTAVVCVHLRRTTLQALLISAVCSLVFLLPHILWYFNAIPSHIIASVYADLIAFICAAAVYKGASRLPVQSVE